MRPATEDEVRAALSLPSSWSVTLTADGSYVGFHELDGVGERICARLGGAPARVGESTYVLGLASRLWAATLVPAVRSGVLPDPSALRVRDDHGSVHLGLVEPRGWTGVTPADVLREVVAVLTPVIAPSRLSHRLLWGNVASALHATPRACGVPAARPWVAEMLEMLPLRGEMHGERRATCCLFYEAGGGLCGDCVLTRIPTRPVAG